MSAIFSLDNIICVDKSMVRKSFASAAETYDGLASLQRKVGLELLNKFILPQYPLKQPPATKPRKDIILDLGTGTGFLTQQLLQHAFVKQLVALDIALSMLHVSRAKLNAVNTVQFLCADAECLPLANNSVDKIVSNLALQWCQNLTAVFAGFYKVLKQEGELVFSTFGCETLKELKWAWSEVDDYAHVNEFYTAEQLNHFLQLAGFQSIQIESKRYQSSYLSVIELMKELKGIGANKVISGRNRKMTGKGNMQNMLEAYEKFRVKGKIPATYEIIFVTAKN